MGEKLDWQKYEKHVENFAKNIIEYLIKKGEIKEVIEHKGGRNNKLEGKSGVKHQIDFHVKYISADDTCCLLLGECKLFSKDKIGLPEVRNFYSAVLDIRNFHAKRGEEEEEVDVWANLFTTIGYTSPAKKFAGHYGIATNSAQYDRDQGSLTLEEIGVVIKMGSVGVSASIQNISADAEDKD
jgi:hypothetical protein